MSIAVNLLNDLWKETIRYLVGYNSTNIFRVWIPHQGKVISIRDVIFDEDTFFDKKDLSSDKELIAQMDELVARVSLEPSQAKNEEALEEDEEILYSERTWDDFNESSDGEDDGVSRLMKRRIWSQLMHLKRA